MPLALKAHSLLSTPRRLTTAVAFGVNPKTFYHSADLAVSHRQSSSGILDPALARHALKRAENQHTSLTVILVIVCAAARCVVWLALRVKN